jgi:hypothetical protein
MLEKLEEYRE